MDAKMLVWGLFVFTVASGADLLAQREAHAAGREAQAGPPIAAPGTANSSIRAALALEPERPQAGAPTTLALSFTRPDGTAVGDLVPHHARRVHVLLVSEDLRTLGHVHPQDFGDVTDEVVRSGRYAVAYTFPRAGAYIVGVDVMTPDEALSQQFIVHVAGEPGMGEAAPKDLRREKCFRGYPQDGHDRYVHPVHVDDAEVPCPEGYEIALTPSAQPVRAGEEVRLRYRIESNGEPVTDLAPYLDAAIHLAIVPASFDALLHHHGTPGDAEPAHAGAHGGHAMPPVDGGATASSRVTPAQHGMHETPGAAGGHAAGGGTNHGHQGGARAAFGPELVSEPLRFPRPGLFQVFGQVKHGERIIYSSFMIEVLE